MIKESLGEENWLTQKTISTLADLLRKDAGEFEEAMQLYKRCLAVRERVLGVEHNDTLMVVMNMGCLFHQDLKDLKNGLAYYERAFKGYKKVLGRNHPDTLMALAGMATAYFDGGKNYQKAEELNLLAIQGYLKIGKVQEYCKASFNLAAVYAKSGEKEKLRKVLDFYPHIIEYQPSFKDHI